LTARLPGPKRRTALKPALTTPDLVLLSLLAERPMHGYEINAVLEERHIREWAGVSRPQIYYSLDKLVAARLIAAAGDPGTPAGPERRVFKTTREGIRQLSLALESPHWSSERARPPFLTWLALSWQAAPGVFEEQLDRRRAFLEAELGRAKAVLDDVLAEVGHPYHEAVWMLKLTIAEFETELAWIDRVAKEAPRRQPARPRPAP
jgi:DNA-binding PadR family transcriptional regulator